MSDFPTVGPSIRTQKIGHIVGGNWPNRYMWTLQVNKIDWQNELENMFRFSEQFAQDITNCLNFLQNNYNIIKI